MDDKKAKVETLLEKALKSGKRKTLKTNFPQIELEHLLKAWLKEEITLKQAANALIIDDKKPSGNKALVQFIYCIKRMYRENKITF